jgi:RHS repeat-associated protein
VRRPRRAAFALAVLLAPAAPALAQSASPVDGITPLGLAPGRPAGSFALSGFEAVNLFNGHLSFALPLLRVQGRGEAGFTMHLTVERRWSLRLSNVRRNPGEPELYTVEWDWGVNPGYGPGAMYQRSATQRVSIDDDYRVRFQEGLTRLTFRGGDNTEHDFRDDRTDGRMAEWWEGQAPFDRGTRWHATDGSAATFLSDGAIRDAGAVPLGTRPVTGGRLLLADGTEYRIGNGAGGAPGRVTRIRDRNGNLVHLEHDGGLLRRATDSLGRVVTIEYRRAAEPWEDEIRYGGFGGAARSIVVRHRLLHECLVPGETVRRLSELFPTVRFVDLAPFDPRVACEVELPNGTAYDLAYNAYGELSSVTLPTGGRFEYAWGSGVPGNDYGLLALGSPTDGRVWSYALARRVKSRKVHNYGQLEQWSEYDADECGWGDCRVDVRHLDPDGVLLASEGHSFVGGPLDSFHLEPCDYSGWQQGRATGIEVFDPGGNRLRSLEQTWEQRAPVAWWSGRPPYGEPANDVRLVETVTTVDDDGASRAVATYAYDQYNNVTEQLERGPGVERRTVRAFLGGAYAQEPVHIRNRPQWEEVRDAGGTRRARTDYEYDNYGEGGLLARGGVVGWEDVGRTARGNLTAVKRWLDRPGRGDPATEAVTRRRYDVAGNLWKETDPEGRSTAWHYEDNYGRPDGGLSDGGDRGTFARPTLVRNALGHETRTQFDFETGLPVDQKDPNGVFTRLEHGDALDRLTRVVRGAGLPEARQTSFTYTDGRWRREVLTHEDQDVFDDGARKTRVRFDELGREWQSARKAPHPQPWIVVDTRYDARGRPSHVSNPYEEAPVAQAWTVTTYDALDRPVRVQTPDGAAITTGYAGPVATVTDAVGRRRASTTDVLGRVVEVVEHPDDAAPWTTFYSYDLLDHLTGVTQGSQPARTFSYDSLGRLREASNPESGLVRFEYDKSGTLTWRRDARGVETTYDPDALGRVRRRAYSDGTPPVSFAWDENPGGLLPATPWSRGRLLAVDNGVSRTEYSYGPHGHVGTSVQRTGADRFAFSYVTDLAGHVVAQRYPSGRVVNTAVDKLDRVTSVVDAVGPRASDFAYAPHGAPLSMRLGNGLVQKAAFNSRLQPTEIALDGATSQLLSIQYRYWPLGAGPASNDGNVWEQKIWARTLSKPPVPITQVYGYDGLNRLRSASEAGGWSQEYRYDRWGNRVVLGYVPQPAFTPRDLATHVDSRTNRLRVGSSAYDPAGNQTTDALGRRVTYDAENRQTGFNTAVGADGLVHSTVYGYDGEGRRVLATGPEGRTVFVYDAQGRLAAEYSDAVPPQSGTRYLTTDALGSVRVVTDDGGRVVSRHDYLPFGEEIPGTVGARSALADYRPADLPRHRFTGKERDRESGLDYFGARYFSAASGRFTGADPDNAGAMLIEPQSWNGYAYTLNNPLKYVDPDGEAIETVWDAANLAMDVASFASNVAAGNVGGAALDAVGLVYDAVATAVPLLPGGAGTIIKAARAADKVADAVQAADNVTDAAKAVDNLADLARSADRVVDAGDTAKAADAISGLPAEAYRRPSGATTRAQRETVQGQPCVGCGKVDGKKYADHKDPLVKQHYEGGGIDKRKMRDPKGVQAHCPTCSNRQGAEMSRYSRAKRKELGLD